MLVNRHTTKEQRIEFYESLNTFWVYEESFDIRNELKNKDNVEFLGRYSYGKRDKDKTTLNILGPLDSFFGNTRDMVQYLDSAKTKSVQVNIASPGGILEDGLLIAAKLRSMKNSGVKVNTNAVGTIASAATIPYITGTTRSAEAGSRVMIHSPYLIGAYLLNSSNAKSIFDKAVKYLEAGKMALIDSYVADGMDMEFAEKQMDGNDHWYGRKEAIEKNLINDKTVSPKIELIKPKAEFSEEDSARIKATFAEASKYWNGDLTLEN